MENHNRRDPKRSREDFTGSNVKGCDIESPAPKRIKVDSSSFMARQGDRSNFTAPTLQRRTFEGRLAAPPAPSPSPSTAIRAIEDMNRGRNISGMQRIWTKLTGLGAPTPLATSSHTKGIMPAKKEPSETLVDFQTPLEKKRPGEAMKDFLERQKKYYEVNGLGKNKKKPMELQTGDKNDVKIKDEDHYDDKNDIKIKDEDRYDDKDSIGIKDEDYYDDEEGFQQSNNQPGPSSRTRRRPRFNVEKLRRTNRGRDRQTCIEFPAELHDMLRGSRGIVGVDDVYLVVMEQNRHFAFFQVLATTQRKDVANQLALSLFRTEIAKVLPELRESPGLAHEQEKKSLAQLADGGPEPHEWTKAVWYRALGDIRGDARLSWYIEREGYSAGLVTLNAALPGTPFQATVKVLRNSMVL